ncbi:leucine-rich repeat-containing protein 40 [Aplysia californica]|uniref:Leucine-rich repeat-containing protein 40 n=1 Tax=Aplysia californica TaxID=6500 RepID=A0ABM0JJY1_APLCA|nr:leucine-rich repeat-containing protein 40 [Aplysia californica]XP_005095415.1 leucine-rich repeat-containing protein 40 [Aplysia californica]
MALELFRRLIQMWREFRSQKNIDRTADFHSFVVFQDFVNNRVESDSDRLQVLHVDNTENDLVEPFYDIPINIGRFAHLTSFVAIGCNLRDIPWSIVYLKQLEVLNLSFNCLSVLPNYIGSLSNLKSMNLESNCLQALPSALLQLSKLEVLNIDNNKGLISPPYLVCKKGLRAIKVCLKNRSNHRNLWENCRAYYTAEEGNMPWSVSVQPLVVISVQCILASKVDYLCQTFLPPRLKSYLQEKEKEEKDGIQLAKCGDCGGYFSNVYHFEVHECKVSRNKGGVRASEYF